MRVINIREVATVQAGLRLLQQSLADDPELRECEPLADIFAEHEPLSGAEIDSLCEELNSGRA